MAELEKLLFELLPDERWEQIRGMPLAQALMIVKDYAKRIEEMLE